MGVGEVAIIDMTGAARRRIVLENRDPDAKEFAGFESGFGPSVILGGHVLAAFGQDAIFDDLRRLAGSRKSARDFGAEGNEFVFLRELFEEREAIRPAVVFAFFARQAGADQDFFHCGTSLLFSQRLFYVRPKEALIMNPMQESWSLHCGEEVYPCLITYKRMRNIRFHFAKDGRTFCVSCPYGIPRKNLQDSINKFFPKMLKKMAYEPPFDADSVYLFGVKTPYPGFGSLEEKERNRILKDKLLAFVGPAVEDYGTKMGVSRPYKVRVRSMESRYGVN